jgi:MoaA/NifB/PqqE/SkfB family radical SAM enzyme
MHKLFEAAEKYDDIVVWGYGECGKIMFNELQENLPHKSLHICDNKHSSNSSPIILKPSEAYKLYPKALFVIGSDLFRRSIIAEMQNLGIPSDNIFFKKTILNNLDYHITEHCNLNCASCSHFSNLAKEEFADFETFERDMKQIAKIFNKNIICFNLLGGEPLLNPDIKKFIATARAILPESNIQIITNGILLPKMPNDFWTACETARIEIHITHFPIKINTIAIEEKSKKFNVAIKYKENPGHWDKPVLNINGSCNSKESFLNCIEDTNCSRVYKGRLYPCTIIGNAEHFNKKFGTNLIHDEKDSLDIYAVKNSQEILDWLSEPKPFCCYCDMKNWQYINWSTSTKTINEYLMN